MKCPKCGYENKDDALYCGMCMEVFKKKSTVVRVKENITEKKNIWSTGRITFVLYVVNCFMGAMLGGAAGFIVFNLTGLPLDSYAWLFTLPVVGAFMGLGVGIISNSYHQLISMIIYGFVGGFIGWFVYSLFGWPTGRIISWSVIGLFIGAGVGNASKRKELGLIIGALFGFFGGLNSTMLGSGAMNLAITVIIGLPIGGLSIGTGVALIAIDKKSVRTLLISAAVLSYIIITAIIAFLSAMMHMA